MSQRPSPHANACGRSVEWAGSVMTNSTHPTYSTYSTHSTSSTDLYDLRWHFDQRTHLDRARAGRGNTRRERDAFVKMLDVAEVVSAQRPARFGKRAVGHEPLAVADANAGCGGRGLQLRPADVLAARLNVARELSELGHELLP